MSIIRYSLSLYEPGSAGALLLTYTLGNAVVEPRGAQTLTVEQQAEELSRVWTFIEKVRVSEATQRQSLGTLPANFETQTLGVPTGLELRMVVGDHDVTVVYDAAAKTFAHAALPDATIAWPQYVLAHETLQKFVELCMRYEG